MSTSPVQQFEQQVAHDMLSHMNGHRSIRRHKNRCPVQQRDYTASGYDNCILLMIALSNHQVNLDFEPIPGFFKAGKEEESGFMHCCRWPGKRN